jgi:hypothetical protein
MLLMLLLPLALVIHVLAQDEAVQVDVSAADRVAATYGASNFASHLFPPKTLAGRTALAHLGTAGTISGTSFGVVAATIPAVPAPGFYGEDLTYFGGKVLKATTSNPIYVNMGSCGGSVASCWGNPAKFLADLSNSNFIHLTDQYVGTTANNRYQVGTASEATIPLFGSNVVGLNDILAVVHAAAEILGTGYGHVYHVFLPKGVDTCFPLSSVCYSPDNPATFKFCAYHGSVTFSDIGHVLVSVEPFQNVPVCAEPAPNPNGALIDSTNNALSHELIESITDPDPNLGPPNKRNGWVAVSSLVAFGNEIGDLCVILTSDPRVMLDGRKYQLQSEYSNRYHACAFAP